MNIIINMVFTPIPAIWFYFKTFDQLKQRILILFIRASQFKK